MSQLTVSHPWDMAGVDGLVAARALFGESVDYLAPFQSMEAVLEGEPCAVLRLCDRNFRITYPGRLDTLVADFDLNLWVKQLPWMDALVLLEQSSTVALPAACLPLITAQATVRAPHRLRSLPLHHAVPVQFSGIPILVWHHLRNEQPCLEIHIARTKTNALCQMIQSFNLSSVSFTTAIT